jgi:putative acetyltransferase
MGYEAERLIVRPFVPADQTTARRLILDGLGEHFGSIDKKLNPDLNDIAASYLVPGDLFVVAHLGEELVCTGALVHEEPGVGRLVRMPVRSTVRRRGVGRALVTHLITAARQRRYHRLVLETNTDWDDTIGLYIACGFAECARTPDEINLARDL